MRIRKRQVPLPLSSLIPVPLSDLYSSPSPAAPVQHFGGGDRGNAHPQPSDRCGGLIRRESINGCGFSDRGAHDGVEKLEKDETALRKKEAQEEDEDSDAVASKNVDSRPETCVLGLQNSPDQVIGRSSHEEEKVVPLKKRRGICFEDDNNNKATMSMMNVEMKTKMDKKCNGENRGEDNLIKEEIKKSEAEDDHHQDSAISTMKGRKKGRGGALMEGSRCSRVNGRGWRCCQPTLVGYSLCEHHLGKGRLRSMTNVKNGHKNKEIIRQYGDNNKTNSGSLSLEKGEIGKKRVKLGMVKARSISSLLGQTSGTTEIVAPADYHHHHHNHHGEDNHE